MTGIAFFGGSVLIGFIFGYFLKTAVVLIVSGISLIIGYICLLIPETKK